MSTTIQHADPISEWFAARNIKVLNYKTPDARDLVFAELAEKANTSHQCHRLLRTIGYKMRHGQGRPNRKNKKDNKSQEADKAQDENKSPKRRSLAASLKAEGMTPEEISEVQSYAKRLLEFNLIKRTFRNPGLAVGVRTLPYNHETAPTFNEFAIWASGGWLEHVAVAAAKDVFDDDTPLAMNLNVEFENKERYEIDLFALVDGEPVWVECKSGQGWKDRLPRYAALAKYMGASPARSILAVRHENFEAADADEIAKLGVFHRLSIVNSVDLTDALVAVRDSEPVPQPEPSTTAPDPGVSAPEVAASEPAPKKTGFLSRLFGKS